jgi:subtilase family serine protease
MVAMAAVAAATLAACSHSSLQQSMLPAQPNAPFASTLPDLGPMTPEALMVMQSRRYRACETAPTGYAACYAILSDASISGDASGGCNDRPGCYLPSDLQAAYGITSAAQSKGKGVTVAVVDAYGYGGGYSGLAKDLATYRTLGQLPACGQGCLTVVNQNGGSSLPKPGKGNYSGWQGEIALDIDMVSAICPNCNILLVEADNSKTSNLEAGVATAMKMANVVSNSWGGAEYAATETLWDSHPGKVIVASAGDDGAGVLSGYGGTPEAQPCGFTGVVCVGGTSLNAPFGNYKGEKVWEDFHLVYASAVYNLGATGSGCSAIVAKPSWQNDKGCKKRSATDVSADADPVTGVAIACIPCSKKNHGLIGGVGGTSAAAPMIAAMYALAGNAGSLKSAPQTIWTSGKSSFHDITQGFNDGKFLSPPFPSGDNATGLFCKKAISYICKARTGYDGPTGWGSPKGLGAF